MSSRFVWVGCEFVHLASLQRPLHPIRQLLTPQLPKLKTGRKRGGRTARPGDGNQEWRPGRDTIGSEGVASLKYPAASQVDEKLHKMKSRRMEVTRDWRAKEEITPRKTVSM
ncbi:uncharacterized protein ACBT44_003563 [Syngnathus typhle]